MKLRTKDTYTGKLGSPCSIAQAVCEQIDTPPGYSGDVHDRLHDRLTQHAKFLGALTEMLVDRGIVEADQLIKMLDNDWEWDV